MLYCGISRGEETEFGRRNSEKRENVASSEVVCWCVFLGIDAVVWDADGGFRFMKTSFCGDLDINLGMVSLEEHEKSLRLSNTCCPDERVIISRRFALTSLVCVFKAAHALR